MDITFRATEFEPDERLKGYVVNKVARLQRYLPDLERADIELSQEPTREVETRRIVQINLILYERVLVRVERKAADPYAAVDAAVDSLKHQLLRYKQRRLDWRHHRRERHRKAEEELREQERLEAGEVPVLAE